MKTLLSKIVEFSAAHRLYRADWSDQKNLEVFGKCSNPGGHGHNYKLIVTVSDHLSQDTSMVFDAGILKRIITETVVADLDHRNMNTDVSWLHGEIPTVELIAQKIWQILDNELSKFAGKAILDSVILWETSTIYAECRRS